MGQAGNSSGDSADVAGEADPESVRWAVKLSPKQRLALEVFRANGSTAEAAQRAGCDPSTVSRWLGHDVNFIAAHNSVILENIRLNRAEMVSLLPLANAAIRKQLEKGNGWIAMQLHRDARVLGLLDAGPTTAAAVKKELKLAQEKHEAELVRQQMQLQEQQREIQKLTEKLNHQDTDKKTQAAIDEGYFYAWLAFYADWMKEREKPDEAHHANLKKKEQEQREDSEKFHRAMKEHTPEKYRKIMEEADRLQQQDEEKKARGQRVKSASEQADVLIKKYRPANTKRTQELALEEQRQKEQRAAEQQLAGAPPAPSAPDGQRAPGSQPPRKPNFIDESLADLKAAQAEFGVDDNADDENDEAWEAKAWKDAEQPIAESEKSTPDVSPTGPLPAPDKPVDASAIAQSGNEIEQVADEVNEEDDDG